MQAILDFIPSALGIGPNYRTDHASIRDRLEIGNVETYRQAPFTLLEFYYTIVLNYGSTIEDDVFSSALMQHFDPDDALTGKYDTPGTSVADQWYNTVNPNGKKKRGFREGLLLNDNTRKNGSQALFCYYRGGGLGNRYEKLAFMIVDKLDRPYGDYGTNISNVRFGFDAHLDGWSNSDQEFDSIVFERMFFEGRRIMMTDETVNEALLYGSSLVAQLKKGQYDPDIARADIVMPTPSAWEARRQRRLVA